MPKTILGIGGHYDDCVFGIPGILLQAVRKNHRVVILSLIGDYSNWKPARGRHQELVEGTRRLCADFGVEMRFLDFAGMNFDVDVATKRVVAEAVAKIQPDVAFMLWPHDRHSDHEVSSRLSTVALKHADRLIDENVTYRSPRQTYWYDNGPRHTVGFEPNTFVDVSDDWLKAMEWLGRLMALARNVDYDPLRQDGAVRGKETLALYRGSTCGVRYAEALRSFNEYPRDIL
jgi:LmbE family N-acetylglucosaminyl deacetylase